MSKRHRLPKTERRRLELQRQEEARRLQEFGKAIGMERKYYEQWKARLDRDPDPPLSEKNSS